MYFFWGGGHSQGAFEQNLVFLMHKRIVSFNIAVCFNMRCVYAKSFYVPFTDSSSGVYVDARITPCFSS